MQTTEEEKQLTVLPNCKAYGHKDQSVKTAATVKSWHLTLGMVISLNISHNSRRAFMSGTIKLVNYPFWRCNRSERSGHTAISLTNIFPIY